MSESAKQQAFFPDNNVALASACATGKYSNYDEELSSKEE
jgi:hypothetical protein